MAGRRTFCSFHYKRDVQRAAVVRNAGIVDAKAAAGWTDASIWEEAKKKGDAAIQKLINDGLSGTTVTAVLIGKETASRRWVNYEIQQSIDRGNGVLGVRIHMIPNFANETDPPGPTPKLLLDKEYPVYNWDRTKFGAWVEKAAVKAGHPCLAHNKKFCTVCG